MRIVVFGAAGLLGRAICSQLEERGHRVIRAGREGCDLVVDFRYDSDPEVLRSAVKNAQIVVNAAGILIERDGNTWDKVHHRAVAALAAACEAERVARIVHISALGAGRGIRGGYLASKLAGEQALDRHGVDYAVVRPGLLVDPACPSTRLFALLASLPVIALPGLRHPGASRVSLVQATDVAACVARIVEHPKALRRVIELGGHDLTYRKMLALYRAAQGKGRALWLPLPWWLMKLAAWFAQALPQRVFSVDTLRMLQAGLVARADETRRWLGREPGSVGMRTERSAAALASMR